MLMSVSGIHVEMGLVKTPLDLITVSATQALNSLIIMIAWVSTPSLLLLSVSTQNPEVKSKTKE